MQKNETQLLFYFAPFTNMNSKSIKVLNVRPEIIKLLEENISSKLTDIDFFRNILWFMFF